MNQYKISVILPVYNVEKYIEKSIDSLMNQSIGFEKLQIILIDGTEKLSTGLREKLYKKCKEKGLQFIATRTTDDTAMTVVEL